MSNIVHMSQWLSGELSDNAKHWLLVLFVRGPKRADEIYRPVDGCAELQRRGLADTMDGWVFLTAAGARVAGMGAEKEAVARHTRELERSAVDIRQALAFMLDTHGGSVSVPEDYPFGMIAWKRVSGGSTTFRIDDEYGQGSVA